MKKILFLSSYIFTLLVCIFMLSKLSLNGYITDFYFFLISLLLNLISFRVFSNTSGSKSIGMLNLAFATWQIIALCLFLGFNTLKVEKVYTIENNKYNLYASISGWYKRAYFKPTRKDGLCKGVFWQTKVPYYFPLIEIEISRETCVDIDMTPEFNLLINPVPE